MIDTQEIGNKRVKLGLTLLEKIFPECFNRYQPKPLKIDIAHDIFNSNNIMVRVSRKTIRAALRVYTFESQYKKAVAKGEWRYDLQGKPHDEISPLHKTHAQTLLKHNQL